MNISIAITIVTAIAGLAAVIFELVRSWNARFDECTKNISCKDNKMTQLSASIQLRTFIQKNLMGVFSHKKNATNLVSSILKDCENGHLQKVLGDSLSYVGTAHGLDLQEANLHKVCIKPRKRIEYEISGDPESNKRSVDLSNSDMYRADISESTVCNVIFDKGVFYDTLLYGTSFHNCSFVGANFAKADLRGTKFYACDLTDANFKGARRVSMALVYPKEKHQESTPVSLINYLDESGVFGVKQETVVYDEQLSTMSVFLSKLGGMTMSQKILANEIQMILTTDYGVTFKNIDRCDYRDSGQLVMIQDTMSECNGAVVLAFTHMRVYNGEIRGDKVDTMEVLTNCHYSSPWLQIETAFARSMGLPCLIIAEGDSLNRNGIFDDKIVNNDDYIFFVDYKGYFDEQDCDTIQRWKRAVEGRETMKR